MRLVLQSLAAAALLFGFAPTLSADIIFADELTDIAANGAGTEASIGAWDTVNGIVAPSTTFTFVDGTDGTSPLTVRDNVLDGDVPSGEILPNNNMTAGGWDTSFALDLDGATQSINLTSLVVDIRLAGSGGGDNSTGSKSGQLRAVLNGSVSGALGSADLGGNLSYPTVEYTRTIDLTGLPTLDTSETYTLTLEARGTGFGHFKSLQALELNGDIVVPEPSTFALIGLGVLVIGLRRRRR